MRQLLHSPARRVLTRVLLSRAFSGHLATQWRQANMQELLAEMREQAHLLDLPMPDAVV
ncbi:MAG: hypothetical protein ACYC7G_11090 [Rudaea sp.]